MSITATLIKCLVRQFYLDHVGFFFVAIFFAFGLLRTEEHIAIAQYAAKSPALLLVFLGLWTVYVIRTLAYARQQLTKEEYRFMGSFTLLGKGGQLRGMLLVQAGVNLPVLLYAGFVTFFGIREATYQSLVQVLLIGVFMLMATLLPALSNMRFLSKPYPEEKIGSLQTWINQHWAKPTAFWYLYHLLKEKPVTFILAKALSLGFMGAFLGLYYTADYDWRVIGVGMAFGLAGNLSLAFEHDQFQKLGFGLGMNLPIKWPTRMLNLFISFGLLAIPEILLLLRYFPLEEGLAVLLGLGLLCIIYPIFVALYLHSQTLIMETLVRRGFVLTLVLFFSAMFGVWPVVIAAVLVLGSFRPVGNFYAGLHE